MLDVTMWYYLVKSSFNKRINDDSCKCDDIDDGSINGS